MNAIRRDNPTRSAPPRAVLLLKAMRLYSLPVSALGPWVAAAVVAAPAAWRWDLLIVATAGAALVHLVGNLLNDYFDWRLGVDRPQADDADRPGRLLVRGLLTPRDFLMLAACCAAPLPLLATYLVWQRGAGVLAFAAAGLVAAIAYTAPPAKLKYRMLGEATIFVAFGPLLILGAGYVLVGRIDQSLLVPATAAGMAITAILVGNNWRDRDEDRAAGRTLAHLAGGAVCRAAYVVLSVPATLMLAAWGATGGGPRLLLAAPLLSVVLIRPITSVIRNRRLADIDARTAAFATLLMVLTIAAHLTDRT